jgi:hypothetical protein
MTWLGPGRLSQTTPAGMSPLCCGPSCGLDVTTGSRKVAARYRQVLPFIQVSHLPLGLQLHVVSLSAGHQTAERSEQGKDSHTSQLLLTAMRDCGPTMVQQQHQVSRWQLASGAPEKL